MITLAVLMCCTVTVQAQRFAKYKVVSDSAFTTNKTYQKGNKYQRDAMVYMDLLADTHPFYINKVRRDSLMATQQAVLKACAKCKSDSVFTTILEGVLGPLHDKHSQVIDTARCASVMAREAARERADLKASAGRGGDVMSLRRTVFDFKVFPEHSICYLQFNQCADARTNNNPSLPRFDLTLDSMFAAIDSLGIKTLVVDAQYNTGGNSSLCDELLIRLRPLSQLKIFGMSLRFSPLMAMYNPNIVEFQKNWESQGHVGEMYSVSGGSMLDAVKNNPAFVQPKVFDGNVVFVQSHRTYSSAGMLMTLARDNHIGTIIGESSTFPPSHYGEILPFILPNTGEAGTLCCKYFTRPDTARNDDASLEPDVYLDLTDKGAVWTYIVNTYGKH